jgi:hypothetical protein
MTVVITYCGDDSGDTVMMPVDGDDSDGRGDDSDDSGDDCLW